MKKFFCGILTLLLCFSTMVPPAFAKDKFVFVSEKDVTTIDGYKVPTYIYAEFYQHPQFGPQYLGSNTDLFLPESVLTKCGFVTTWDKKTRILHIKPKQNFMQKSQIQYQKYPPDTEVFHPVASNIKVCAGDKDIFPLQAYHNGKEMMICLRDLYHYFGSEYIDQETYAVHFTTKATVPSVVLPTGQAISLKDNLQPLSYELQFYSPKESDLYLSAYALSFDNQSECVYLCIDNDFLEYVGAKPSVQKDHLTFSASAKPFVLPPMVESYLQGPFYIHTVNCHLYNQKQQEIVSPDNYPVLLSMNENLYIRADKIQKALS